MEEYKEISKTGVARSTVLSSHLCMCESTKPISDKMVQNDMEVFTSDVKLLTAQQIEGVRFISSETYLDPVKVVSIGVPIDTLLLDVPNK